MARARNPRSGPRTAAGRALTLVAILTALTILAGVSAVNLVSEGSVEIRRANIALAESQLDLREVSSLERARQ